MACQVYTLHCPVVCYSCNVRTYNFTTSGRDLPVPNRLPRITPICYHSHSEPSGRRGYPWECAAPASVVPITADCWFDGE
jgi:hypothetical protein